MNVTQYNYMKLVNAVKADRSKENISALANWFCNFGYAFWNGEFFDVSELGERLYPIYEKIDDDVFEIVAWELR